MTHCDGFRVNSVPASPVDGDSGAGPGGLRDADIAFDVLRQRAAVPGRVDFQFAQAERPQLARVETRESTFYLRPPRGARHGHNPPPEAVDAGRLVHLAAAL